MYREVAKLLLYSDLGEDSILKRLCGVFEDWEKGRADATRLTGRIYAEMKRLLDLSTACGFDTNLWHNYLTYLLITNENSFTLTCERTGAADGSVNHFAAQDLKVFKHLFEFDFGPIEADLGIDCFSTVTHYRAIEKREGLCNRNVSRMVQSLSLQLAAAADEHVMFGLITRYFKEYGVGMFGLNKAFRIRHEEDGLEFCPISNGDPIRLSDLVGYESQKAALVANTRAFVRGLPANNVLLYGDSGTGKSSSIKALLNEFYDQGLRMIEIYKYQFRDLPNVIARIKNRNFKFIIYIDDLSFEDSEVEYKFLKAVIEGGVEARPDNILIYATSNRRHLIRETWSDRGDMEHDGDIHRSDTVEEKLSLSTRFGVTINYSAPSRQEYQAIVKALAKRRGVEMDEAELLSEANRWELRHGGVSGRTAQQFINDLSGRQDG